MTAQTIDETALLARLEAMAADARAAGGRRIVALAGPPGAGKSTLAARALWAVNAALPDGAAVLPMDGFHFDDEVLVPRGWRPRKGAPHTFDVGGLKAVLMRLQSRDEPFVAVPRFDRTIEIARAGAMLIHREVPLILVEGNWLLLDEPPWSDLQPFFDMTVLIEVSEAELARRLRKRWVDHGLDEAGIRAKLEENDLPNGRHVYQGSRTPDLRLETRHP